MSKKYYACVYGGASSKLDEKYLSQIEELGKIIVENGFSLVYGAGASGCMGAVARGVRDSGGYIMGVCPSYISVFEPLFECDNTIMVETMAERKMLMEKHADVFFIAPGGIGTMDEFFQILTLKYLKRLNAPIVILNLGGFYDSLIALVNDLIKNNAAADEVRNYFHILDSVDKKEISSVLGKVVTTK